MDSAGIYRDRIYRAYNSARLAPKIPKTVDEFKPFLPHLGRLIHRHFPSDRSCSILDLGCGYGSLLYALHSAGYHNVRGVDGSQEQVDGAKRLGIAGVEFGDITSALAAAGNETIDVVITYDVIEHFTKNELNSSRGSGFLCPETGRPLGHSCPEFRRPILGTGA